MALLNHPRDTRRKPGPGRRLAWYLGMLAMVCLTTGSASVLSVTREAQLKGVLLYNLPQFVEWPQNAFDAPDSPIVLGILGKDPFGPALDEIIQDELVQGRRIQVERYQTVADVRRCHILFLAGSVQDQGDRVIAELKGKAVLTVAEFDNNFLRNGGMVYFYKNNEGKIRLKVNLRAVKSSGLSMSARLLRVAEVVHLGGS